MARAISLTANGIDLGLTLYEREVVEKILNPVKKSKKSKKPAA
jgi:hypothetical protein